jgi:hypothetical protein
VVDGGPLQVGARLKSLATGAVHTVSEVGLLHPLIGRQPSRVGLHCGQVGYVVANMRTPAEAVAGDTLCLVRAALATTTTTTTTGVSSVSRRSPLLAHAVAAAVHGRRQSLPKSRPCSARSRPSTWFSLAATR